MATKKKESRPNVINSMVLGFYNTTAPATNALNRSATTRVTGDAGAARNAARVYNTILTAKGTAVGRAISLLQRTGVSLRRLGLPCKTGGFYLPVKDIPEAQNIYDDALMELDTIREDILATYCDLTDGLRSRLGKFADEVEIPTASQVSARFSMTLTIVKGPAPLTDGVLRGVATEVANRVKAESQQQVEELLRAAHSGPVHDLKEVLEEFIDRMRNAKRLHMSQFDKLRTEVKRAEGLNVLNLPEVSALLTEAGKLTDVTSDNVSEDQRTELANKAESVRTQAAATLTALGLP